MDFKSLKNNSGKNLAKMTEELNKFSSGSSSKTKDDRFWQAAVDKAGNGMAIIRFLPAPGGEDVPFVRLFEHGFKGPTGLWYIEKSLTTIGKPDPVAEYNTKLWNSSSDDNSPERKQVRDQKRRVHFISNILVISDPANPENEGKVFLFKYGKKIFDKLQEKMVPEFPDETPMDPFDLWGGAPFKLKIRKVEGYTNYDKSEFGEAGAIADDKTMEKIWKSEHSLQEFVSQSSFKTYDELKDRLLKVLDEANTSFQKKPAAASLTLDEDDAPSFKASHAPNFSGSDDDEDESIEFFKSLAK
jgi:gp32 DNA binding protein like